MKKILGLLPIVLCVTAAAQNDSKPTAHAPVYITHVAVINTKAGNEAEDRTVVISGDRILEVRDSKNAKPTRSARIIDGTGKFLIPGLWDMHVHALSVERLDSMFPMFVANGVLGIRDMGTAMPLEEIGRLRHDTETGARLGPLIVAAGPILDGKPKPMRPNFLAITTVDQARETVRSLKARGVDFIKVYSWLSPDVFSAIADEAKKQDITFGGHVPFPVPVLQASNAGQKSLEHLYGIALACSTREEQIRAEMTKAGTTLSFPDMNRMEIEEAGRSYSAEKASGVFAHLAEKHTWVVPTFTADWPDSRSFDASITEDSRLRFIPPDFRQFWSEWGKHEGSNSPWGKMFRQRQQMLLAMYKAGVPVLTGTDAAWYQPYTYAGFSLHDELALLVQAGLTPAESLRASTIEPAKLLGREKDLGSIVAGKLADLVLLDGDPLQDIRNTTRISGVYLSGKYYDRAALDLILKNAEQKANASLELSPAEQEVWTQEETYWRSLKADDRETYLGLWDERFIGWPQYEGAPASKEKIRQEYAPGTTARGKVLDYRLEPLSVRSYGNDVVITFFRATVTRGKPNGEVETHTSRLTHTWMKTDQGWRIIGGMAAGVNQDATVPQSNPDENTNHEVEGGSERIQQVLAADEARRQAMLKGDVRALDSLLADDVTVVWGDGTTDDKASTLELFRSGRLRYSQTEYQNTKMRMLGDTAIVTGDAKVKAESDGESIEHLVRVTRVYARRQGQWRLVAVQTTRAATPVGASFTGKMAMYSPLLGGPWTCTADVPAMGGQSAHTEKDKVTFSVAPQNVLLIEVSSPQFAGRNFIGFDSKSNQYWRTEMGVFGGILRETSTDGVNFSGVNLGGPQATGSGTFPVRSVLTVEPDGSSTDTEVFARNGSEVTFKSRCTR